MTGVKEGQPEREMAVPPNSALGRLSLTPATQTTVVTTTTTTTVSYPPFVMRAPKDLSKRDPEVYPLAATPTPAALKKLRFSLGGQIAQFEEADDATTGLQQYGDKLSVIRAAKGSLVSKRPTINKDSKLPSSPEFSNYTTPPSYDFDALRTQSTTPPSLDDEDASATEARELGSFFRRHPRHNAPQRRSAQLESIVERDPGVDDGIAVDEPSRKTSLTLQEPPTFNFQRPNRPAGARRRADATRSFAGSSTPPQQDSEDELAEPVTRAPGPSAIDTTPAQEVSLPSPSLSPITAAAQMSRSLPASRLRETEYFDTSPSYLRGGEAETSRPSMSVSVSKSEERPHPSPLQITPDSESADISSVGDINNLLNTFDAMPEDLQSYVMFQLLRRCSKKTLVVTSRAVTPALKVDFLKELPAELHHHVIRLLDRKSLCRAAQVSKKWREVVDGDERAWMELVVADGFKLARNDVERAIREGWGWQFPRSKSWVDKDLGRSKTEEQDDGSESHQLLELNRAMLKRKRKDTSRPSTGSSERKRRRTREHKTPDAEWPINWSKGFRPKTFADTAELAVPMPSVGNRSLRMMHLFKSMYRRQYLMRQSWLNPKTKPKHIAFKAHEGHVVTCLQFDSEKILTGSDDAIIDIYDTTTGARMKRLSGHEGGVWALEYQDNILVSGSTDRSVRIWNMDNGKCLHVFQGHTSTVRCLQIVQPVKVGTTVEGKDIMMPPHRLIITGSRDSNCRIWRLPKLGDRGVFQAGPAASDQDNPYFVRALTGHSHSVRAIAAHADTLVSGSYDGTVRVWQISTGETLHRLSGHSTKVYSVVLDHERKRCISGSMDTIVKVWSIETGECLFNLSGHQSLVGLLDLKDDILVSAAADFTLKVWDPETGQNQHTLKAHTGAITCFAHDGHKVISGSERTLKMWDIKTGRYIKDLLTDLRGVWQVRFDERRCIAAVHRDDFTFIEVLDFGAAWDRVPDGDRGRRIVVDTDGEEISEAEEVEEVEEGESYELAADNEAEAPTVATEEQLED